MKELETVKGVKISEFIDGEGRFVRTNTRELTTDCSLFVKHTDEWKINMCHHHFINGKGSGVSYTNVVLSNGKTSYIHYKRWAEIYVNDTELVKELLMRQLSPYVV